MMSSPAFKGSPGRQRELPTFYYHQHFMELLEFVSAHYAHVLAAEQSDLVDRFRKLDRPAQCLYVRLVNRKGRIFAANRLRYPEIGDLERPLAELRSGSWIGSPGPDLFDDVLASLTRAEIYAGVAPSFPGLSRSLKKSELIDFVHQHSEPAALFARIDTRRLLVQQQADWVQFLLFLYFGECRDGLSRFTMRDMGLVRTHAFTDSYEARFSDREEALQTYYFAKRIRIFDRGSERERRLLADEVPTWPEAGYGTASRLRDRLAYAMGREQEKAGAADAAMDLYGRGDSAECSERIARLLFARGQRDQARIHLEACLDNPRSDEEWFFANDLYQQKFGRKRTSSLTDALRAADTIELDEAHSGSPEQAAILYFENLGQRAFRSENTLWRSLFGLLFWDELFAPESTALHSPFEGLPSSLRDRSFYELHAPAVEEKLAGLSDVEATKRRLLKTTTRHFGTANGLFRWRRSMAETIFALIDHAAASAVAGMLRRMCRDYPDTRYGFPDLLVIDQKGARFVEIKAPGDQVRRNQLVRMEQMREAGLRAGILRIRWILDPEQTYVVVDVETTGGSGDQHRITELAAVKVRDGKVVDRFQTLIDPQRPIPPKITRLTGITDDMVAGAPRFPDIADEFAAFMGDAIFAAHNVNFDYGFISREYGRLGRRFRHAKLCTCASMRRLYPGLPSYSLGALCAEFDLPLKQHHRALCDAEAAAELLLMVNEKRAEALSPT
ncbi:MAG: exonuclease domain-containing protein [Gammaproteobacteria bacterium]|jgi:DNA polymerase-3 subunit epsilon